MTQSELAELFDQIDQVDEGLLCGLGELLVLATVANCEVEKSDDKILKESWRMKREKLQERWGQ